MIPFDLKNIERLDGYEIDSYVSAKVNEVINIVNELIHRERTRNYQTHENIIKVGDGELAYCTACHGGEVELYEATCSARQGLTVI